MTPSPRLDNPDFIPIALYQLGGAGRFVDIEDLFMHCYEMAPERFKWRKHDIPNYKILSKALRDFEDKHPDLLIRTPDGLQRQLSAEGVRWIERRLPVLNKLISADLRKAPTRRPSQRVLNEVSQNPLFLAYKSGASIEPSKYEVADLLLCSPDSPPSVWEERLQSLRSAAQVSNRPTLRQFLDWIYDKYPSWFGEQHDEQE